MSALDAVRGCFVAASLLLAGSICAGPVVVTDPNQATVAAVEIFDVVPAETIAGEPYAVHVRVAGGNQVTGVITVSNEDTSCEATASVASSCELNSYSSGIKTIAADYPGDASNPPSSASVPHKVGNGKIVIQTPNVTAIIGAQSTVTPYYTSFPANPAPTGVFEVYVAGNLVCTKPIGGGPASLACSVPPILVDDEYPVDVIYAGDANFIGATGQSVLSIIPQPCSANDVTLSTQAAVNAFQAMYGPCAFVTSRLTLSGADITDLSPLAELLRVNELFIESNAALSSLNGLGNIKRILNQVRIQNNPLLAGVGLGALDRAGAVTIDSNAVLTSLAGMASLARTTNQLRIQNNPMLTNLGMPALTVVGADLWIDNNVTLASLAGLAAVTRTGNQVRIQNSPMLTTIGLDALTTVGTDLMIENNAILTSLAGLDSVTSSGNQVRIANNPMLTTIGLNALTVVGTHLEVTGNAKLTSMGLGDVVSTGNRVDILNNPMLTSVGLSALTVVGTDLEIANNAKLASLAGLGNLASTGGKLYIRNNPLLTSIGMSALTTVGTELRVQGNSTLTSLVGLGNVVSTGNAVRILSNPQLASIDLNSLTTVAADLEIEGNAALTSLAGLASTVSSGSRLEISNNSLLASLDGLQAFRSVQTDVEVFDNAQLSDCGALTRLLDAVDDALPGPGPGGAGVPDVGSLVMLSGNQTRCNSIGQIERIHDDGFE